MLTARWVSVSTSLCTPPLTFWYCWQPGWRINLLSWLLSTPDNACAWSARSVGGAWPQSTSVAPSVSVCACVCVLVCPLPQKHAHRFILTAKPKRSDAVMILLWLYSSLWFPLCYSYSLTRSPSLQVQCQFSRARGDAVLHMKFMKTFDAAFEDDDTDHWGRWSWWTPTILMIYSRWVFGRRG